MSAVGAATAPPQRFPIGRPGAPLRFADVAEALSRAMAAFHEAPGNGAAPLLVLIDETAEDAAEANAPSPSAGDAVSEAEQVESVAARAALESGLREAALRLAPDRRIALLRRRLASDADLEAAVQLLIATPSVTGQKLDLG